MDDTTLNMFVVAGMYLFIVLWLRVPKDRDKGLPR